MATLAFADGMSAFPDFPRFPSDIWEVNRFQAYEGIMTKFQAADMVHRVWQDFAIEVIAVMQELGDRIAGLPVADDTMLELIHQVSKLIPMPGITKVLDIDDRITRGMKEYANTNIHRNWRLWGLSMQCLYRKLVSILVEHTVSDSHSCNTAQGNSIDSIDFGRLHISKPELSKYDSRQVFRDMLNKIDEPSGSGLDYPQQVTTFLNILFEAVEDANKMPDADAEALVDQMEMCGLEPDGKREAEALVGQLESFGIEPELEI